MIRFRLSEKKGLLFKAILFLYGAEKRYHALQFARRAGYYAGRRIVTVVPFPGALSSVIVP